MKRISVFILVFCVLAPLSAQTAGNASVGASTIEITPVSKNIKAIGLSGVGDLLPYLMLEPEKFVALSDEEWADAQEDAVLLCEGQPNFYYWSKEKKFIKEIEDKRFITLETVQLKK